MAPVEQQDVRMWWRPTRPFFEIGQPLPTDAQTSAEAEATATLLSAQEQALKRISVCLLVLTLLAVMFTLAIAQQLVVPILLAAFLSTALSPPVAGFARFMPRALASALVLLMVLAALYGLVMLLAGPAQEWAERIPDTFRSLLRRLRSVTQPLSDLGGGTLMQIDAGSSQPTRISLWAALTATPPILAKLFSVLLLTFFFLVYGDGMLRRSVELSPSLSRKKSLVAVVRAIQRDTSHYLFITTIINLLLGAATAVVLWALKFPDPLLFGALVAVANFIPYIGALSMLVVLALVGISQSPHLGTGLAAAASFALLAAIEGHFLTPAILGQRLSLSPVAIVVWLLIWGWMWGLPGVLLGVPLLMCLKIIVERIDGLRWVARAIE